MARPTSKIRRLQAGTACENCRRRRSRCDAARPQCSNCQMRSMPCEYTSSTDLVVPKNSTAISKKKLRGRRQSLPELNLFTVNDQLTPETLSGSSDGSTSNALTTHDARTGKTRLGIAAPFEFTTDPCLKEVDTITTSYKQSQDWLNVIRPLTERQNGDQMALIERYFEVPPRDLADDLLDVYFRRTHKLYPFIHEGDFRAEYESMWRTSSPKDQRFPWFGVLNMVFAFGCESCESIAKANALAVAAEYVARAKDIIFAHALQASTLETIQALLLMCHYLQSIGELNECWNLAGLLTRTAQGLGLHVNPSAARFLPIERELRKRAWVGCLVLDRSLSLTCGRPPSLGGQKHNVDLPLEVDDLYIRDDTVTPRQPSGTPSTMSFFVSTLRLSHIVSDVSTNLYLHDFDQYSSDTINSGATHSEAVKCNRVLSTVLLLDGQLQSWWRNVPDHLKHESTYQSQHVALKAKYLYVQLLIFRRTFLYFAQNDVESFFLRSVAGSAARLAVESACDLIHLLSSSNPQQHLESQWKNAQYVFASLCVLCVFETMDKNRRSNLDDQIDSAQVGECYRMGLGLLHAADQSSKLVVRFIAILDRLRRDRIGDNRPGSDVRNVNESYWPLGSGHVEHIQQYSKAQPNTFPYPFAVNALGPMFDNYIDFSDLDYFLTDFGSIENV